MIKHTFKSLIAFFLLISSSASAGLITTELTEDTYISIGGYDWTWASPVNVSDYDFFDFGNGQVTNTFKDSNFHSGWMDIVNTPNDPLLEQLFLGLTLADFTDKNGDIIHSVAYWNTDFTDVNADQFDRRAGKKNNMANSPSFFFETFYVRASVAPASVPEPTTLFILSAGLIGFALRKRNSK